MNHQKSPIAKLPTMMGGQFSNLVARYQRPNYHSHEEREAFKKGWDDHADSFAYGYPDKGILRLA